MIRGLARTSPIQTRERNPGFPRRNAAPKSGEKIVNQRTSHIALHDRERGDRGPTVLERA